ncbi:GNAT family N-acetyltransferase [Neisseria dentiae]|uniref:GNAT family N-acetyltransferase n=1 Tax=Neisseria dentiae TaxID=194197 RepID=UPI00359F3498
MTVSVFPLSRYPQHIEPLANALFAEWHDFAPWSSLEKIRAYYQKCLRGNDLPQAFVAVGPSGTLLGSAALKRHDIASLPQYEYWLGDVFVLPEYRGKGAGNVLITYCLHHAQQAGIRELYLYTPDMQSLYARHGWHEIEKRPHNGETVSVMKQVLPGHTKPK